MLPPELIQSILFAVILDSVHLVALSPSEADWETEVFTTLAKVSYTFYELAVDFAAKAFSIPDGTPGIIFIAEAKLKGLQQEISLKMSRRNTPPTTSSTEMSSEPPSTLLDCNLLKAYVLFVAIRSLWINTSSDAPPNIFLLTEHCLQAASTVMQTFCREPDGAGIFPMTGLFARCVDELRDMAGHARVLVGSTIALNEFVVKWNTCMATEDETNRATLLELLKTLLDTIGEAEARYSLVASNNLIGLPNAMPSARLPGLLSSLSKLSKYEGQLGLEEVGTVHDRVVDSELRAGKKYKTLGQALERVMVVG